MLRLRRITLSALVLVALAVAAWPADQVVSLYSSAKLVKCDPAARVRDGVTYAPLRAAAQATGAHVTWDAVSRRATLCLTDRCVPIKASQGIMVNNALLIPVRLLSQALGRKIAWDPAARAVRIE